MSSRNSGERRIAAQTIMVCGGKGGVGKTTIATSLALTYRARGLDVAVLDVDLQGPNIPTVMSIDARLNVSAGKIVPATTDSGVRVVSLGLMTDRNAAVTWRGPMLRGAIYQLVNDVAWGKNDVLIVDTPPGTGDIHSAVIAETPVDGAVMVSSATRSSVADTRRCLSMLEHLRVPISGIVSNMSYHVCSHCGERTDLGQGRESLRRFAQEREAAFCDLPLEFDDSAGTPFRLAGLEGPNAVSTKFANFAWQLSGDLRLAGPALP